MAQLVESKRKAVGWVAVAVLINMAAIGFGLAMYEGKTDCFVIAFCSFFMATLIAWRLA